MLVARQHGLIFNLDKCRIKQPRTFFGMLFNAEGVHPDPKKIEAIKAIQEPQDAQELQTFLGIATYMAPFIPNLSAMSEPLRNLLKKDTDFQWSSSHSTAFESIKQAICQEVSLTYFDPKKETVIQVDASMWGSGNALIQDGKAVAFASTALTDTKKRYANIEREMLAVVVACEKFHFLSITVPGLIHSCIIGNEVASSLCSNLLSSIWTIFPSPPSFSLFSITLPSHIFLQKLSQSTPVRLKSPSSWIIWAWSRSWLHQ